MGIQINGQTDNISAIDGSLSVDGITDLTVSGNLQTSSINNGPLAGTRNRIINGDMRIDQRNTIVTASNNYTVDRWVIGLVTSGAIQVVRSDDAPTTFSNSVLFDVTTADTSIAATEAAVIQQPIEGLNTADLEWGSASAQPVTLSFWIKSTTTGTYCVAFRNSGATRSYVAQYSVAQANTWEYKTVTVPGDTSGTWLKTNGTGIIVAFTFMAGTNFQTTANTWGTGNLVGTSSQVNLLASTSNEARITGVQLEPGTVATPFERRNFGQELALCQRYFQKGESTGSGKRMYNNTGNLVAMNVSVDFPVTMRTSPTITVTVDINDAAPIAGGAQGIDSSISGFSAFTNINNGAFLDYHSHTASAEL